MHPRFSPQQRPIANHSHTQKPNNDRLSAEHLHEDWESLTISTDIMGPSGGLQEDNRPRSNSCNIVDKNPKHSVHIAQSYLAQKLDETKVPRTGSAENVTNIAPTHKLIHSNTAPEIPPLYREGFSNDSGYGTPPKPRTSPSWPASKVPAWVVQQSPTPGALPSSSNYAIVHPVNHYYQPVSHQQTPPGQRLTIDVAGHYHEEPESSNILVLEPPGMYTSYPPPAYPAVYRSESRHHAPTQLTKSSSEEGILNFQRDRRERLVTANNNEKAELHRLNGLIYALQKKLDTYVKAKNQDSETEKEVGILKQSNNKLKREVMELRLAQKGRAPVAPPRPPLPHTLPSPAVITPMNVVPVHRQILEETYWNCPRCTYQNHGLINSCEMCDSPRPRIGAT